ncbi:type II CRISPR RNA-guided endonuclease Cas9 [Longitalea luteola]|uniref:type II CRISPR RNA-guided endonuclease Cas9 n=1 Tax=Longitalea luteola TaxID=2812563 RepID=UPI001A9635FF|nr:type II CRISPR RNA-guided endonuclease Cas9 [Longitalea luteola]
MQKILGLDIGTNSIGWALVDYEFGNNDSKILGMGCRIIPMDGEMLGNYEAGVSVSQTANRRQARGSRRLKDRYKLRRKRLIAVLKVLGWLPDNFTPGHILPVLPERLAEMHTLFGTTQITQDWLVYYLRKKALTEKIELTELARILLHMNQRRGFKSNRKANNEAPADNNSEQEDQLPARENKIEVVSITAVKDTGEITRGKKVFEITLANGIRGTISRDTPPDWEGKEMELEIRTIRSKKDPTPRYEFAMPNKSDWQKMKEALQKDISAAGLHIGEYVLNEMLKNRNYRVRERIVDRSLFIAELTAIWDTQKQFHPELSALNKNNEIADALYTHNQEKRKEIQANDLLHVLLHDIIYYQRPLKSKISTIGDCRFEKKSVWLKDAKGNDVQPALKVIPASAPLFQEFRIWKTIHTLKIFVKEKKINGELKTDVDETAIYLTSAVKESLFYFFDNREEVELKDILKFLKLSSETHYINYPDNTRFKGNTTKSQFRKLFNRLKFEAGINLMLDADKMNSLWHLVYSIDDSSAIENALKRKKWQFPENVAKAVANLPAYPSQYGAYSSKALNKMLPLMRCGKQWTAAAIDTDTLGKIEKILTGEFDESIDDRIRGLLTHCTSLDQFQGLPEHLATYVIYGKHSEKTGEPVDNPDLMKGWEGKGPANPIVKQVVNETIQVVKAVWKQYGRPDEIRIELARDLKKTADERKELSAVNFKNQEDKRRIKAILRELKLGDPESLADIDRMRILEENGNYAAQANYLKFFKKASEPTGAEIEKYRLWVEQNCISPYTGKPIQLSRLFTRDYDVDHIIPRSRYYDDSMANKVIVETWANAEKDNLTAMQYIRRRSSKGDLLSVEDFSAHVNRVFRQKKRRLLLSDEIPEGFIQRQLNDTRYITKKVVELLSQVVESKKVKTTIGQITDELKYKWGLNDMMKRLLIERFERLEKLTGDRKVEYVTDEDGKRRLHLQGYEKRIDHRHHAVDALVTACTLHEHIQYINTLEAQTKDENEKYKYLKLLKSKKTRDFKEPWHYFIPAAEKALEQIIVSFKNRHRILNKGVNKHLKYIEIDGHWVKDFVSQTKGELWSVRQPLHKETVSGKLQFRRYKSGSIGDAIKQPEKIADRKVKAHLLYLIQQLGPDEKKIKKALRENPAFDSNSNPIDKVTMWYMKEYYGNRVNLDETFTAEKIKEKIATYNTESKNGLKNILLTHLAKWNNDPKAAFTGEGMEALTKTAGKPITKVTIYEDSKGKFEIRKGQFVEAAKGTNLFFVIYENIQTGEREYETLRLDEVIIAKANGWPLVEAREGFKHFILSPNDLVYVPEEGENTKMINWSTEREKISKRIYRVASFTGPQCFFVPHNYSKTVIEKVELGSLNKQEKSLDEIMIKKCCIKLKVDKLGNVLEL